MTRKIVQRFTVPFEYPVYFTRDVFDASNAALAEAVSRREPARRHRVFVVVDSGVADARPRLADEIADYAEVYHEHLELAAAPEVLRGGERVKNDVAALGHLLERFLERSLDRQSCVIVIGGGAVQDMAGYAAAIAHRGLRIVRMPTTVASQNDVGVGVKNAMNAFGVKNFVGTFHPPFAVLNDLAFIDSLPARDRIAGVAEAVKVGLIRDRAFFEWLEGNAAPLSAFAAQAVEFMIRRSAELHLEHIATSGDPFEFGSAKPLDYGHWLAHKLESLTGYELRHGEAVAIGMAVDARYSCDTGLLAERDVTRICALLERLGLGLWHETLEWRDAAGRLLILDGLREFREHLGGELVVTMLESIGRSCDVNHVDEAVMARAIGWLQTRARSAA